MADETPFQRWLNAHPPWSVVREYFSTPERLAEGERNFATKPSPSSRRPDETQRDYEAYAEEQGVTLRHTLGGY